MPKSKDIECRWCAGVGYFPNTKTGVGSGLKAKTDCHICQGKGNYAPFTPEEIEEFKRACWRVWEVVASDLMACAAECGQSKMKRAEVIECVLDADRLTMYGVPYGLKGEEREKMKVRLRQIQYSNQAEKIAREVFTARYYE